MPFIKTILTVTFLLSLLGCSANKPASYDYQTDYDFSALKTFSILPIDDSVYNNPKVSEIEVRRIGNLLKSALSGKYSEASSSASSDFLVRYFIIVQDRVRVDTFDAAFGMYPSYRYYHGIRTPEVRNTYYQQGSIIVDILDAKTEQVVWRGSTEGKVKERVTPEERDVRVRAMLNQLLEHFPPSSTSANH